jgi:hypothetical protein
VGSSGVKLGLVGSSEWLGERYGECLRDRFSEWLGKWMRCTVKNFAN